MDDATASLTITDSIESLRRFVAEHRQIFVLTGAGCSTDSGIADYRDQNGEWKRPSPVTLQAFVAEPLARQRYWARSLIGWPRIAAAQPNDAHRALQQMQVRGLTRCLLTQNVDGLHQRAGSTGVIDLHGRLDQVCCLSCKRIGSRMQWQQQLTLLNQRWLAQWLNLQAADAPDGDADLDGVPFERLVVPPCEHCGGIIKPDVVLFGEIVPRDRVEAAMSALAQSDAMLVVGSSLMVYSGFRFARAAVQQGIPIAAIGLGKTRADELLAFRLRARCAPALQACLS